jgi:hypothetical protein
MAVLLDTGNKWKEEANDECTLDVRNKALITIRYMDSAASFKISQTCL